MTIQIDPKITKIIHQKRKEQVKIPVRLFEFLKGVQKQIENNEDIVTTIESDDGLQDDYIYGGLEDMKSGVFYFTYYPDPDNNKNKWGLRLTADEIKLIAEKKVESLELWACQTNSCHSKFSNKDTACGNCDFITEPTPDIDEVESKLEFIAKGLRP